MLCKLCPVFHSYRLSPLPIFLSGYEDDRSILEREVWGWGIMR